ncbi:MAG: 30S ribosomal protein S8 [Pseudomonadota bacterium]
MTMQDPIADMLTRIRNAQMARHEAVEMPSSTAKVNICKVLRSEGYVGEYRVSGDAQPVLWIELKYHNGKPVIEELERISRPGLRSYAGKGDLPDVRGGLGVAIVSTNRGVMTDRQARAEGVGGEVLCTVF